jgi:hypothetical protein
VNCEICGREVRSKYPHHIITRGAYGGHKDADNPDNTIWLCLEHHTGPQGVHTVGRETFFRRWLLDKRLEAAKAAFRVHSGGEA